MSTVAQRRMKAYTTLTSRIAELEKTFRHMHVNSADGTDTCKQCGLDLRDEVHIRANEKVEAPK